MGDHILDEVQAERDRARASFKPFNSAHEALAVIWEEFEELKLAIFWGIDQYGQPADPRFEAIQLAASAVSLVKEIYDREP